MNFLIRGKCAFVSRFISILIIFSFITTNFIRPSFAQTAPSINSFPAIPVGETFNPAMIKGVNIHPDNPLQFDFIVDKGEASLEGDAFVQESAKLIRYFMAALAIPEDQMWVNLSPYEKDRIIPETFSHTEMGRDLLAQDYLLKQVTASLLSPQGEIGKDFWQAISERASQEYGAEEIPTDTFNKVWIVPQEAKIYEHKHGAFIVKTHLKVMLDEDYLALEANQGNIQNGLGNVQPGDLKQYNNASTDLIRKLILPAIEREVNEGKAFANLRQIYHSVLLAAWFKESLKQSVLAKAYADQSKVNGIAVNDPQAYQEIYAKYLKAFEQGAVNLIQENYDPNSQQIIPKKYFSGGATAQGARKAVENGRVGSNGIGDMAALATDPYVFTVDMSGDHALLTETELFQGTQGEIASGKRINVALSAKPIDAQYGVNNALLPQNKTILVLEYSDNQADIYAGNLLNALTTWHNTVVRMKVSPSTTVEQVQQALGNPADIVIAPDQDEDVQNLIVALGRNQEAKGVDALFYTTLEHRFLKRDNEASLLSEQDVVPTRVNLTVRGDSQDKIVAGEAMAAHVSQLERTPYGQILDEMAKLAKASADAQNLRDDSLPNGLYANNFTFVKMGNDGRFVMYDGITSVKELGMKQNGTMIFFSPHPDDMELAAPFLALRALKAGMNVYNWIQDATGRGVLDTNSTVQEWLNSPQHEAETDEKLLARQGREFKDTIRLAEAKAAADVYRRNIDGGNKVNVEAFGLTDGGENLMEQEKRRILQYKLQSIIDQHIKAVGRMTPIMIALPHPQDAHKDHVLYTQRIIDVFRQLTRENEIEVNFYFYQAPWAGSNNTYFHAVATNDFVGQQPVVEVESIRRGLMALLTGELTASGGFGLKSPPLSALGGWYAESFRRAFVETAVQEVAKDDAMLVRQYGDRLNVYADRDAMGKAAAELGIVKMENLLEKKDRITIMFAAAPSQVETIKWLVELSKGRINWHRVNIIHMDEWAEDVDPSKRIKRGEPESFRTWLDHNLIQAIVREHGIPENELSVHLIDADDESKTPEQVAEEYGALVKKLGIDGIFGGYGENGHVAFNDPAKREVDGDVVIDMDATHQMYEDPERAAEVVDPHADPVNRGQQFADYPRFEEAGRVPRAITVRLPIMLNEIKADPDRFMIMSVPGEAKANAIKAVHVDDDDQPVTADHSKFDETVPATYFNQLTNRQVQVFTDVDGASQLPADAAMSASAKREKVGGIDFNPTISGMEIERRGQGVMLPVSEELLRRINPDKLAPAIINIVPVTNLPLLIGQQLLTKDDELSLAQ